jgi:hypothetical protein
MVSSDCFITLSTTEMEAAAMEGLFGDFPGVTVKYRKAHM